MDPVCLALTLGGSAAPSHTLIANTVLARNAASITADRYVQPESKLIQAS